MDPYVCRYGHNFPLLTLPPLLVHSDKRVSPRDASRGATDIAARGNGA